MGGGQRARPVRYGSGIGLLMVKTRFAPSPTGYLHLGNARIALLNQIVALQRGGKLFLRIEDTDRERSSSLFVDAMIKDLAWLGISREGDPVFQSSRFSLYREKVLELWSKGWAYPCFCTPHELEAHRQECLKKGRPPRYSGRCRHISFLEAQARIAEGEPFSLRLRVDPEVRVEWRDMIKGRKRFRGKDLDDIVLLRSDGLPTYHLAVVVDDGEMGITHVIRGEDHMANTPYHISLFEALGYPVPFFAHVPLVKAPSGEVLEKREDSPWTLKTLRKEGYLSPAVVNFLITLGWNPPHPPPLTWEEILESFELKEVSPAPVSFHLPALNSINRKIMAILPAGELMEQVSPFLSSPVPFLKDRWVTLLEMVRANASTLAELAVWVERVIKGSEGLLLDEREKELLRRFLREAKVASSFTQALPVFAQGLDKESRNFFYRSLRKALTGEVSGPPLGDLMDFLGDQEVEKRISSFSIG